VFRPTPVQCSPPLKTKRGSRTVVEQLPGNPVFVFSLGGFKTVFAAKHIQTQKNGLILTGIKTGRFLQEECILFIGSDHLNHREDKDYALTIPGFRTDNNGGDYLFRCSRKKMTQEEISHQTSRISGMNSGAHTIIVMTENRVESIGASLRQLKHIWGKTHSEPIIEGEYICLHKKEGR